MRERRKLAAVMAADIVGYARLMGRDEGGTLARLKAYRGEHLEPALARNGGRLVKLTGDGVLVEFGSAVDALRASIEFQEAVGRANEAVPAEHRILFRVGLHLGDMIVDSDDLYGDGINIAARLEAEAPPGGIVVSGALHEAVAGKLDVSFGDLGQLVLKNIERPVQAYRVAPGDEDRQGWPGTSPHVPPLPADKPSIAVLPLENLSGDSQRAYFADGIVEDIITALSHFRGLFVISRNSSFAYKGKAVDARQVGRELGVRYVLEGSCREAGNMVRVTAQLVDCSTANTIWAETFDRTVTDVFAVEEQITRPIVSRIAPAIEASALARTRQAVPSNLGAYDLAMRAWAENEGAFWHGDPKLRDGAMETARRALKLDPNCVRAWVTVATIHWQWCVTSRREAPAHWQPGLDALQKAISIDPFEHRAYMIRGGYQLEQGQYDEALADYRLACELNPNDALALTAFAWGEIFAGEGHSAKARVLEALRLSPRDPLRGFMTSVLALACFQTKEYAEGLRWAAESNRDMPHIRMTRFTRAQLHVGLGNLSQAREEAGRIGTSPGLDDRLRTSRSRFRQPEDRDRDISFLRLAFGLRAP